MPGYLGNDPAGSATKIARQTYTTSGAATTDFTFTSGYDVGYLDVYVNGERQTKGKNFTASDGSTFKVLNGGVGTGSTVEAIAYKTFNLATVDFDDLGNTGNLTLSGDISGVNATFSGDVSIGGTLTYEDVTNIDSVGVITARSGVDILSGGIDIVGNTTGLNVTGVSTFAGPISVGDTISLGDHDRLRFGAGNDLQIYHDGTDNYVQDSRDNGRLRISADIFQVIDKDASEQMLKATVDGAVELSYNGSTKFETTNNGTITVGVGTFDGLSLGDNESLNIGASSDLRLYHDGTDNFIKNQGTGNTLRVFTVDGEIKLQSGSSAGNDMIVATHTESVDLYYNNSKKFETTNNGVIVTGITTADGFRAGDNEQIHLGDSSDLRIYHDGSNSYIKNNTGVLRIHGTEIQIRDEDSNENLAKFFPQGSVELYYDNSKKLETSGVGVTVTGTLNATTDVQINGTSVATAGKAVAMALVFG